jgi:hypothetical protein
VTRSHRLLTPASATTGAATVKGESEGHQGEAVCCC